MLRVQSKRDPGPGGMPVDPDMPPAEPVPIEMQEPAPAPMPVRTPSLRPVSRAPQYPGYGGGGGYPAYPAPAYGYPQQPRYPQPQYQDPYAGMPPPPNPTGNAFNDYMQFQMWQEMRADMVRRRQEAKPAALKPATPAVPDAKNMVSTMKTQLQAIQEATTELQEFMAPNPTIEFLNTPFAGGIGQLIGQVGVIISQSWVEERKMRRMESLITRYEGAVKKGAQIPPAVHAAIQQAVGPEGMPNGGFDPMQQVQQQQFTPEMMMAYQQQAQQQQQQGMPQVPTAQIQGQPPVQMQIIPPQQQQPPTFQQGQQGVPFGVPLDQLQARQRQTMNPAASGGGGLQLEPQDRELIAGFTQRAQNVETLFQQVNAKLDILVGGKPAAGGKPGKQLCPFCQAELQGSPETCPECGENLKGTAGSDDGWGP